MRQTWRKIPSPFRERPLSRRIRRNTWKRQIREVRRAKRMSGLARLARKVG